MRLVIDLQACQATSKNRGIGIYSLALAQSMVRCRGEHEILILLSDRFPETIESIKEAFVGLLPASAIRIWKSVGLIRGSQLGRDAERDLALRARESFLASLQPDFIHVASLFEGFEDDVVSETRRSSLGAPVAVTLYDLIPLLFSKTYLANPLLSKWYRSKLQELMRADLCLAISDSAQHDAIKHIKLPPSRLVNISADANPVFRVNKPSSEHEAQLTQRLGLNRSFIMCTAGMDSRKGLLPLIRAFSVLSPAVRQRNQLVVVCEMNRTWAARCHEFARREGLLPGELILTGYLPELELVALYNLCQLFVFPSMYEGFGLPVLEAMRCAAPVIASRSSSLCEIVVWDQALFNPTSVDEMAGLISRALTEPEFRQCLVDNGIRQSARFSWEKTARTALASMERRLQELSIAPSAVIPRSSSAQLRPRMAFISPLPPERSGISDYSAQLLQALSRYYHVDVIVSQPKVSNDWIERHCSILSVEDFVRQSTLYERVVYQFGNSHYHSHMFGLLDQHPGVVVLHDFFLSGAVSLIGSKRETSTFWADQLFHSHGYGALHEYFYGKSRQDIAAKYPCSLSVIEASLGVIVHSTHAKDLAAIWYGHNQKKFTAIPLVRDVDLKVRRDQARKKLGIPDDGFLVCSFGNLSELKLNHRLIDAWARVMARRGSAKSILLFVGEIADPGYMQAISKQISLLQLKNKVRFTGWTGPEKYLTFLAAADLCVQLRSQSRGETSAAVLDCMNFGQPTIINAHGSMVDIPKSAVFKISDHFTDDELAQAINQLMDNPTERAELGRRARAVIVARHSPELVAARYVKAIERIYQSPSQAMRNRKPRLYIDISALVQGALMPTQQQVAENHLRSWLNRPNFSHRVEPVYGSKLEGFRRAQCYTFRLMKIPLKGVDAPVEILEGDVWTVI